MPAIITRQRDKGESVHGLQTLDLPAAERHNRIRRCHQEPSDEALNTVINTLTAAGRPRQHGDFTNAFRPETRKVIVLFTDEPPSGFSGDYDLSGAVSYVSTKKMYDGGRFHRAVRLDNQVRKDVLIEVIQGGRDPEK